MLHFEGFSLSEKLLITVGLGADRETGQIDLMLPRGWHSQHLQLVIGHPRQFVGLAASETEVIRSPKRPKKDLKGSKRSI